MKINSPMFSFQEEIELGVGGKRSLGLFQVEFQSHLFYAITKCVYCNALSLLSNFVGLSNHSSKTHALIACGNEASANLT